MEARPRHSLKTVAQQLALALSTDEGLRASRLLSRLQASCCHRAPTPADAAQRIGIWNRTLDRDRVVYERAEHESWRLWANVQRIEPKQDGSTRILMLGESVARANEYAPHYSPALVLQSILRACGLPQVEVLDLARLGIRPVQLLETTRASLALDPDALVMFAGNNWSLLQSSPDEVPGSSLLDVRELWKISRGISEDLLSRTANTVAATLGEIVQSRAIPVAFLIPEFNLVDWRTTEPEAPLLDTADIVRWCELRRHSDAAHSSGNYAAAEWAARQMLDLDGGTMAATFRMLFENSASLSSATHRALLEQARDAGLGTIREFSPRCEKVTQEALRTALPKHNIGVIDLPERFSAWLVGALPGRNLFLDNVHMNSTGIRLSMALAAQWLLPRLTQHSQLSVSLLLKEAPEPSAQTTAIANLQAGYVNWSWGQSAEIQQHYLRQALEAHPSGADLLRDFLEYQTSCGHLGTCESFRRFSGRLGASARYTLPVLADYGGKRCDLEFLHNATDVLEGREPRVRAALSRRLRQAYGLAAQGTNLLDRHCRVGPVFDFFGGPLLGDMHPRAYHRAFTSTSAFFFVCESQDALALRVTCRTPESTAESGRVEIRVNGRCVLSLTGTPAWQTANTALDPSWIREGVNDVTVHWPQSLTPWRDRLQKMVKNSLLERRGSSAYPVYGHLHTLHVERRDRYG